MRQRLAKRSGTSLLEISAVLIFLGVLLTVMSGTLVGALKVQQSATNVFQSLAVQKQLANEFRADVSQSLAAPDQFEEYRAGKSCLILQMDMDRHIIYRWEDRRVQRIDQKGSQKSMRLQAAGNYWTEVEFSRKGQAMLSLRIIESRPPSDAKHIMEVAAALGGDRR